MPSRATLPQRLFVRRNEAAATVLAALRSAGLRAGSLRVQLRLPRRGLTGPLRLSLLGSADERVVVGFDPDSDSYFLERAARQRRFSGDGERHAAPRLSQADADIRLDVWVDQCTVEVFADDGELVFSDLVFNDPDSRDLALAIDGPAGRIVVLVVTDLGGV